MAVGPKLFAVALLNYGMENLVLIHSFCILYPWMLARKHSSYSVFFVFMFSSAPLSVNSIMPLQVL